MRTGRTDKINVAICDDARDVTEYLTEALEKTGLKMQKSLKLFSYEAPQDLIDAVKLYPFDVVFMDIDWNGEGAGISAAQKLQQLVPEAQIIYMTGYTEQYVQQAFLTPSNMTGFLVKPIRQAVLEAVFEKAVRRLTEGDDKRIVFVNKEGRHTFSYSSVLYLESTGHKVIVYTATGKYEFYGKLDELEYKFPSHFIRCHKSFLVNMDRIDGINKAHQLILDDGTVLPVSKLRYGKVKERFLEYVVCK